MSWLADYWWLILLVLIGMIWNGIKALMRLDPKRYLDHRPPCRLTATITPSGMRMTTGQRRIKGASHARNVRTPQR